VPRQLGRGFENRHGERGIVVLIVKYGRIANRMGPEMDADYWGPRRIVVYEFGDFDIASSYLMK
jgi:hypothetical protein